ncbi:hypothetical protein AAF712_013505 [Marasmius tenuissimus]|uniref:Uncharacterized protein n=1 Tax=Marasmius tenuissimus TaxID=585030 RepID=A0ABR2ZDI8_9AGAR
MPGTTCKGCKGQFTDGGYLRHIGSTANPRCRQLAHEDDYVPPTTHHVFERLHGSQKSPVVTEPAGDYFGPYTDLPILDGDVSMDQLDNDNVPMGAGVETVIDEDFMENGGCEGLENSEESEDELEEAAEGARMEQGWEPDIPAHLEGLVAENSRDMFTTESLPETELSRSPSPCWMLSEDNASDSDDDPIFINDRHAAEASMVSEPMVDRYPDPLAGAPLPGLSPVSEDEKYKRMLNSKEGVDKSNIWSPFGSEMEWRIAQWAKLRGPSSTAFTELLSIPNLTETLGLSFKSASELNKIIDERLPSRPEFKIDTVVVGGEAFEVYFRDTLECVKALFSEPDFAPYMKYAPEKHWTDETRTSRMYHDMYTGEWWWSRQKAVDERHGPGSTIIPLIFSTDKTLVTNFRGKSAYPIYMTLGNIPKEIRRKPSSRAYILVGYLPTSKLEHITIKAARRRAILNIFHSCMKHIVKPLEKAGVDGTRLSSGDGVVRRAHPLLAIYACDYPEQITVTCARYGDCPECQIIEEMMGEGTTLYPVRDLAKILHALATLDDDPEAAGAFKEACRQAGVKPVFDPFWKDLPYSNIFRSITPDILHQLYQGLIKHLKNWVIKAYGAAEIDARCRRLPPNHHVRLFMNGISSLSRLTGQEHNEIARFLLSIIIDIPLPGGFSAVRIIRCVRGLIDFLYLAQYPTHTDETLSLLSDALERFHANKNIFVDLDIRPHFQLPKLHFLNHYIWKIRHFGSLDNSDTQYTERLHIDMTKDAYRASNRKDEFVQMTKWLERKEKVMRHSNFLEWRKGGCLPLHRHDNWLSPTLVTTPRTLELPKNPTVPVLAVARAEKRYSAPYLLPSIARFIHHLSSSEHKTSSSSRSQSAINPFLENVKAAVTTISAFSIIRFIHHDPITNTKQTQDSIHSQPGRKDRRGRPVPGRFDTALVRVTDDTNPLKAYRIGQVRLIFTLPQKIMSRLFVDVPYSKWPRFMAYIEWFSTFTNKPDPNHLLHKVSRVRFTDGGGLASVVDVSDIVRSAPLTPRFGKVADRSWTSSNVLEKCNEFFVNPYPDQHDRRLYIL